MPKKAIVTGATGFLGRQVLDSFRAAGWSVVGTGHSRAQPPSILKVDLVDEDAVHNLVQEQRPDIVIHCAANRSPDKVDKDPAGARAINKEATQFVIRACEKSSSLCVYISTDYVFPGRPGQSPYEVDAVPEPTNLYGETKLDGERVVLQSDVGIVLRIPVLYGKATEPKESAINVLLDVLWKAQEKGARIEMDDYALRYPTHTEDVARVLVDIASTYVEKAKEHKASAMPHLLQFTSEDKCTKYEICTVFAGILNLSLDGIIPKTDAGDTKAGVQRPFDTHLSTKQLRDVGIDVKTQDFKAWWQKELDAKST